MAGWLTGIPRAARLNLTRARGMHIPGPPANKDPARARPADDCTAKMFMPEMVYYTVDF